MSLRCSLLSLAVGFGPHEPRTHYGNPLPPARRGPAVFGPDPHMCLDDEDPLPAWLGAGVFPFRGHLCSPTCSSTKPCPTDLPSGMNASLVRVGCVHSDCPWYEWDDPNYGINTTAWQGDHCTFLISNIPPEVYNIIKTFVQDLLHTMCLQYNSPPLLRQLEVCIRLI